MAVSASDYKNKVKRLEQILKTQRYYLKTEKMGSPDFKALEEAIRKTEKDLEKAKSDYQFAANKEKSAKAEDNVKNAQDDLAYAQAAGDAEGIKKAQDALDKARAAAEKASGAVKTERSKRTAAKEKAAAPVESQTQAAAPVTATKPTEKTAASKTPTTKTTAETPTLTDEQQRTEALGAAGKDFSLPETLFKNVPSLNRLLERYVNENWTLDKLRTEIRNDTWYRQNSDEIKARYVQLYNYRDLVESGQAQGTTDYEKQITALERKISDKAKTMGSGIASDPEALRRAAENMYITNVGIDDPMTTDFIASAIRPIISTIGGVKTEGYSGAALKNYQALQTIARDNGFKVSEIVPGAKTEQQVLQGLATGALDINRISQDARKLAAQGQPQYVRDLLAQGYDLSDIYAPYRQTMATLLEIDDPTSIDINDPTLRSAISDKGDMNIYDFKKLLRADNRWQYTENAKKEVSDAALNVLRDFGFQG